MLVLGIETSCDETSVAVVKDGVTVKSNVISSSRKTFEALAGVIPEQAARMQVECMIPVLMRALTEAGVTMKEIDAIAVTRGPGLLGSLLVGTVTARALASIHQKPLIGVHHTLGHLSSTWLENGLTLNPTKAINQKPETRNQPSIQPSFPILTLSVSGGHSDIWYRSSHTRGHLLGRTRDDAAGEAFDKGASMLGLPYPGGPSIQKVGASGDPARFDFPSPLHAEDTLDFSFSGLKTSLKYLLRDLRKDKKIPDDSPLPEAMIFDISASFEHAICRHLIDRLRAAIKKYPEVREVHIVGGVSANSRLRDMAGELCKTVGRDLTLRLPQSLAYCTDNAAMIAAAGEFLVQQLGEAAYEKFETAASIPLEQTVTC